VVRERKGGENCLFQLKSRVFTLVSSAHREIQGQRGENLSLNNKHSNLASTQVGYTKFFPILYSWLHFPQYQFVPSISTEKGASQSSNYFLPLVNL
jgi:hypothetical protein